jgi:hypothetical protein
LTQKTTKKDKQGQFIIQPKTKHKTGLIFMKSQSKQTQRSKLRIPQCFWMVLTLQNLKLWGNLEFSWYSCNILRYCSNRCIVWFFIPANCPAQTNRKFLDCFFYLDRNVKWNGVKNTRIIWRGLANLDALQMNWQNFPSPHSQKW